MMRGRQAREKGVTGTLRDVEMSSPTRKPRLQRRLMKKLLAPWRDETELRETTVSVAFHYEVDDAPIRHPWIVQSLPPDAPTAFVVVRVSEHPVVEGSGVYRGDTREKAKAIANALNALEEEAERDQEPEDVSQ